MYSFSTHNREFYNRSSELWLEQLASIKGLDTCVDLEAIKSTILGSQKPSVKILEIGSGFGRVTRWFMRNLPSVRYTGIDFSETSVNHCVRTFGQYKNIDFHLADILDLNVSETFDFVIWPWSGFLEVSNEDKLRALIQIRKILNHDGVLLLDFPRIITGDEKKVFRDIDIVEQHSDFGYVCNQLIFPPPLEEMYTAAGLVTVNTIHYESSQGINRYFTVLGKSGERAES